MKIGMKIGMKRASCAQWSRFSGTSISMAQQRMSPWAMVPPHPPQALPKPQSLQECRAHSCFVWNWRSLVQQAGLSSLSN